MKLVAGAKSGAIACTILAGRAARPGRAPQIARSAPHSHRNQTRISPESGGLDSVNKQCFQV
jgi:hypothetical protein